MQWMPINTAMDSFCKNCKLKRILKDSIADINLLQICVIRNFFLNEFRKHLQQKTDMQDAAERTCKKFVRNTEINRNKDNEMGCLSSENCITKPIYNRSSTTHASYKAMTNTYRRIPFKKLWNMDIYYFPTISKELKRNIEHTNYLFFPQILCCSDKMSDCQSHNFVNSFASGIVRKETSTEEFSLDFPDFLSNSSEKLDYDSINFLLKNRTKQFSSLKELECFQETEISSLSYSSEVPGFSSELRLLNKIEKYNNFMFPTPLIKTSLNENCSEIAVGEIIHENTPEKTIEKNVESSEIICATKTQKLLNSFEENVCQTLHNTRSQLNISSPQTISSERLESPTQCELISKRFCVNLPTIDEYRKNWYEVLRKIPHISYPKVIGIKYKRKCHRKQFLNQEETFFNTTSLDFLNSDKFHCQNVNKTDVMQNNTFELNRVIKDTRMLKKTLAYNPLFLYAEKLQNFEIYSFLLKQLLTNKTLTEVKLFQTKINKLVAASGFYFIIGNKDNMSHSMRNQTPSRCEMTRNLER